MGKVQKTQGNIEIDVTSKTQVKPDAVVTETPFYDHKVDEELIFISSEEEDTNMRNATCNEYIKLSKEEEEVIKNKEMLTDISTDACQRILRKQFSVRSGIKNTILGQKLMFKEQNEKSVQILHNGSFHWLTVSNINCEKNEINYYDSLFHGKIKDHIKMQVCNLYKCPEDEVVIKVRICQQQPMV